jgi:hypothetical protein
MKRSLIILVALATLFSLVGCNNNDLKDLRKNIENSNGEDILNDLKNYVDSKSDSVLVKVRDRGKQKSTLLINSQITVLTYCRGGYEGSDTPEINTEIMTPEGHALKTQTTHSSIIYHDVAHKKLYWLDPEDMTGRVEDLGNYELGSYFDDIIFGYFDLGLIDQKVGQEIVAGRTASVYSLKDSQDKVWFDEEYGITLKWLSHFPPGSNYDEYDFEISEWARNNVHISDMVRLEEYTLGR